MNDVPHGSDAPGDPFAAGRVQSFGDIVQQIARFYPGSIADMGADLQANKPGVSCNKNRSLHQAGVAGTTYLHVHAPATSPFGATSAARR